MTEREDRELDWEAWEVDDLPESFADDVLDAIDAGGPVRDEVEVVAPAAAEPAAQRRAWSVALGAGLAAAAVALLWWGTRPSAPTETAPSELATFDGVGVTPDGQSATWRWVSTSKDSAIAEQTSGRVRWDAQRGVPLTVQTPAGRISTTDADFSVEVLDMSTRKTPLIAGAAVAGTVAALVYLHGGEADLANDDGAMTISTPERAVMTDQAAPHFMAEAATTPKIATKNAVERKPAIDWKTAKASIERAIEQRTAAPAAVAGGDGGSARERDDDEPVSGTLSKEYIRDTVREEVVPLVRECYNNLLEHDPDIGGKMVLKFAIMGDESVGGIVDSMEFSEESEIQDPDFRECLGESMMSTVFDPPEGGGRVEITYPIIFTVDEESAG